MEIVTKEYAISPDMTNFTCSIRMRSLRITKDQGVFYAYSIQNIDSCELIPGTADYHIILVSQHCNFMPINLCIFSILIFPGKVIQYLD